jgi:hypothetical protein
MIKPFDKATLWVGYFQSFAFLVLGVQRQLMGDHWWAFGNAIVGTMLLSTSVFGQVINHALKEQNGND